MSKIKCKFYIMVSKEVIDEIFFKKKKIVNHE